MHHDRKRMKRVIDALHELRRIEEQRAAQQLQQQRRVEEDLEEISALVNSDSLTAALFSDIASRHRTGLLRQSEALGEARRHASTEARRHGVRMEKLEDRARQNDRAQQREADQRDLIERVLLAGGRKTSFRQA